MMKATVTALSERTRRLQRATVRGYAPLVFIGPDRRVRTVAHVSAPPGLRGAAAVEWIQAWEARCARP